MRERSPLPDQRELDFGRGAFASLLDEKLAEQSIKDVLLGWFDARAGRPKYNPSVSEIARAAHRSDRTVQRALKKLKGMQSTGIGVEQDERPDGSFGPIVIRFDGELLDREPCHRTVTNVTTPGDKCHHPPGDMSPPPWGVGGSSSSGSQNSKAHPDHDHEDGLFENAQRGKWWGFDQPLTNLQLLDAATRRVLFRYAVAQGKAKDTPLLERAFHALCLCCVEHGKGGSGGAMLTAHFFPKPGKKPIRYRPSEENYDVACRELLELDRVNTTRPLSEPVRQLAEATSIPAEPARPRDAGRSIQDQLDILKTKGASRER